MSDSPRTLTCPSCGSPLQADENDRRVQCQYCHATVDLPDNDPPIIILPGYTSDTEITEPHRADRLNLVHDPDRDDRFHPVFDPGALPSKGNWEN